MRRRTRPLDPSEWRSVQGSKPMYVEFLDPAATREITSKWPESPLSAALTDLLGTAELAAAQDGVTTDSTAGALVRYDSKKKDRSSRGASATMPWEGVFNQVVVAPKPATQQSVGRDDWSYFTLDDAMVDWLAGFLECDVLSVHDEERLRQMILVMEEAAERVRRSTSIAACHMTSLVQAVPYEAVAEHGSGQLPRAVYDMWVARREQRVRASHPWGLPFALHLFRPSLRDEYFLSGETVAGSAAPLAHQSGGKRSRASSDRASPRRSGATATVIVPQAITALLPMDLTKIRLQLARATISTPTMQTAGSQSAQQLQFVDAEDGRLHDFQSVPLRPLNWAVDDIAAEVADCQSWFGPAAVSVAS